MSEWVRTKDREPEDKQMVLYTDGVNGIYIGEFEDRVIVGSTGIKSHIKYFSSTDWEIGECLRDDVEALFWMPLPELPDE